MRRFIDVNDGQLSIVIPRDDVRGFFLLDIDNEIMVSGPVKCFSPLILASNHEQFRILSMRDAECDPSEVLELSAACLSSGHLHHFRNQKFPIMNDDPMLTWFKFEHLPPHLQATSKQFHDLARHVVDTIKPGNERTVALRKLLEAKDAAVRAVVSPGS